MRRQAHGGRNLVKAIRLASGPGHTDCTLPGAQNHDASISMGVSSTLEVIQMLPHFIGIETSRLGGLRT